MAAEAELEFAEVRAAAVPIIRRLVEQAFLLPALGLSAGQSFLFALTSQPAFSGGSGEPVGDCGVYVNSNLP